MSDPKYKNYHHYLNEEQDDEKKSFKMLREKLLELDLTDDINLLDIGCASGELIKFLNGFLKGSNFTGVDIFNDLLDAAKNNVPNAKFIKGSALNLPESLKNKFDVVTVFGLLGVFDEKELYEFFDQVINVLKNGGKVFIFEPFNEYEMDIVMKHRKWVDDELLSWEKGNSVFSIKTIGDFLEKKQCKYSFHKFDIGMKLDKRKDPQRTWTVEFGDKQYQHMNGTKLLFDMYLLEISNNI